MSDTPEANTEDAYETTEALLSEMQGLQDELANVKQERDMGRDMVHGLRKQRAIARNFGEQMERERDEARGTLRDIASLQRYEHKFWDDGDGQIDESEREKADGMYLLHAQVSKILTRVLK